MSDVKLVPGQVVIEAWDLALDAADRRKIPKEKSPHRRALVHDFNDGLTINWGSDYPGGVTIQGQLKTDEVHLSGQIVVPFTIDLETGKIFAPSEMNASVLTEAIKASTALSREVAEGRQVLTSRTSKPASGEMLSLHESQALLPKERQLVKQMTLALDLVKMLADLANDVNELKKRIEKLEGK